MDGRKDILGVWIGEHESSKFWLNVLNELKSRGVTDVYLFCTDGLCGMMQVMDIQCEDLLRSIRVAVVFADDSRLIVPLAVAGDFDLHLAELGLDCLFAFCAAVVTFVWSCRPAAAHSFRAKDNRRGAQQYMIAFGSFEDKKTENSH